MWRNKYTSRKFVNYLFSMERGRRMDVFLKLPLTSHRGQGLITEFGEKAEATFPPAYDKQCTPVDGFPISDNDTKSWLLVKTKTVGPYSVNNAKPESLLKSWIQQ